MSPRRAALYLDGARRMRLEQLAGRARRLVPPAVLGVGLGGEPPRFAPNAAGIGVDRAPQSGPVPAPEEGGVFEAVGASRTFGAPGAPGFWSDRSDGLLFLFHLHGFRPLAAYAAGTRSAAGDAFWEAVVADWLDRCSRPAAPAWHPYPTSQRVISWAAALSAIDTWAAPERATASLWRQARYLVRSLERDVGGNHLLTNAAAIAIAGAVFPDSPLLESGLALLERETGRQLLADGGHEERSPAYHREILHQLENVAVAAGRARGAAPGWLERAIERARGWAVAMTGPDGSLPLLNDAWEGPGEPRRAGEPVSVLDESGYVVLRDGNAQVVLDVGPLAPAHLPPHAHADALSFVLWWDGAPLAVDPGSYAYTGPRRDAFRATAAHNTVSIDGHDQCEFWGDFRLAYPPRVRLDEVRTEGDGCVVVRASHDGYRRLGDPVVHRRTWVWLPGEGLVVVDALDCAQPHAVRSTVHLHPGARADAPLQPRPLTGDARSERYEYSPFLGRAVAAVALVDEREAAPGERFGWTLLCAGREAALATPDVLTLTGGGLPERTIRIGA